LTFTKNNHSEASIMVWAYSRTMVIVPYHNVSQYIINMFTLIAQKLWCFFMLNTKLIYFGSSTTIINENIESSPISKIIAEM